MQASSNILGISAFYHDSAAALIINGTIIAAVEEERFTRIKHDASFPINAIKYVLEEGGLVYDDLDSVVFYEKPFIKFERLLETYHAFAPDGLISFARAIPIWIKDKLFMKQRLINEFNFLGERKVPLYFTSHHLSHAASAYFPSPFNEAAIVTIDGVGEWSTLTISHAVENKITVLQEQQFPHSIGLFYSAITYYAGFKVNSGEYKLMGLAPYVSPQCPDVENIIEKIKSKIIDIKEDGSILLNMEFFNFATGLTMTRDKKWEDLLGFSRRAFEGDLGENHIFLAQAGQSILEEVVLKLAYTAKKLTGSFNLCMAGGVALNCVANAKVREKKIFSKIWIQPAAGDSGGALGAAYAGWHILKDQPKFQVLEGDLMKGTYLGPEFSDKEILKVIKKLSLVYTHYDDFGELCKSVSRQIREGQVIGWFQGRMEFGPRALGNRSILADPSFPEMQRRLNLKIKNRESFRPFAPAVLKEDATDFFEIDGNSNYMLFTFPIKGELREQLPTDYSSFTLTQKLNQHRSEFQSITHVDFTARVQTVDQDTNPRFYRLLQEFKALTGKGMLINTSMNVRGEPIVCSPENAIQCFMQTEMDMLVIGNFVLEKNKNEGVFSSKWKRIPIIPE